MEPKQSRTPKLFYVTTQSSTTTLTTQSLCWVSSSTALTIACGRKKRMINYDPLTGAQGEIDPSKLVTFQLLAITLFIFHFRFSAAASSVDDLAENEIDIEGSKNKVNASREGKFLVYWMTTTSITTITSYSATRTLASLICTPSGYGISQCG